jgi:quercetin dioxygenase-like cupin family protein
VEQSISSKNFQMGDSIPWQDAGPGIQRQLYGYDEQLMMVRVKFEDGAVGALHHHPQIQASYIESGVFELTIGKEKKTLKKGDGFFVPSGVVHGCTCLEAGILIDVFNRLREDFLDGALVK